MTCEHCHGTGVYSAADDLGGNGEAVTCSECLPCGGTGRQPAEPRGARCADCPHDECDELANLRRERDQLLAGQNAADAYIEWLEEQLATARCERQQ